MLRAGYSVVRSLSEAPLYAAAIACALKKSALVRGGENSRAAALEGIEIAPDLVYNIRVKASRLQ